MSGCSRYSDLSPEIEPQSWIFSGTGCAGSDRISIGPGRDSQYKLRTKIWMSKTDIEKNRATSYVKAPHHRMVLGAGNEDNMYTYEVTNTNRVEPDMEYTPIIGDNNLNWVKVYEQMPWEEWKFKACNAKIDSFPPFTMGSSTCDEVMKNYCEKHPNAAECSCLKSEIPLASCFDRRCTNTNAYKTKELRDQALACPTYMNCNQYLTIHPGARDNVLNNVQQHQQCTAPDRATQGGSTTTTTDGSGNTNTTTTPYQPPRSETNPWLPPPTQQNPIDWSQDSSASKSMSSTTLLLAGGGLLFLIIMIVMIALLMSDDDESPQPQSQFQPQFQPNPMMVYPGYSSYGYR